MPKPGTPIRITLYDPETNEVVQEFSRTFVPWRLLKRAVKLAKVLDADNLSEEDVDGLAALVCDCFGNQFSIEDLNDKADITEMAAVLNMIVAKARGSMPANPTPPGG